MISFDSSSCPNPISLFHHSSVEPGTLMLNKHQLPQLKNMCIQNDLFSGFTQHFVFQKGDSKTKMEQPGNASLKKREWCFFHSFWRYISYEDVLKLRWWLQLPKTCYNSWWPSNPSQPQLRCSLDWSEKSSSFWELGKITVSILWFA